MAYNEQFMSRAVELAKKAQMADEVPVGAVLVRNGEIIAEAANEKECRGNALAHAEMLVLEKGSSVTGSWNLNDCELYCTLEPCPMCGGAMINSRIKTLYYGAHDLRFGCAGSQIDLLDGSVFNHKVTVYGGCMEKQCSALLTDFFRKKR